MSDSSRGPGTKRAARRSQNGKSGVSVKETRVRSVSSGSARTRGPVFVPRERERNFALSVLFTSLKLLLFAFLILGVTGIGAVFGLFEGYTNTVPELDISKIENQSQTSFIYDSAGTLITTYAGLENRTNATYEELPAYLVDAIVSIEDERFFYHNGIDLKRIAGAFLNNLTSSSTQGGSTITQQLIKMRVLSSEQTYKRKLQEAYLAVQLEKQYSKEEILAAYLNTINLGSGNYGVKAAAKDYFGKDLDQLTLRECAMLASIANSPSLYNPRSNYYTKNKPERTDNRTDLVLRNMYKNDKITLEEYEKALGEKVYINPVGENSSLYDMPYFVEYAMEDVITHMLRKRGLEDNETNRDSVENELRSSGYHIYLTVEPSVQHAVEESLYSWNKYPMTANESDVRIIYTNADGTQYTVDQPQAATAVMDYHTGYVKAIVGGRQAPTAAKTLNRARVSRMPVGSSIKPIAVYGPAFEKGLTPGYTVANFPSPIQGWVSSSGYPSGGSTAYYGMTTLRTGIVRSLNIVAARTLLEEVGIDTAYQTLLELGISESGINKDPAGLSLGTSGITVMEMTGAYGAIANGGTYLEPVTFTKVVDSQGKVILDSSQTQIRHEVFSRTTSWLLTDILSEAVRTGTGRSAQIEGITVAGKTGTNNDSRGVFFAGYTGYYVSALWIGHDNFKPLYNGASGGSDAAPLWQTYMAKIHEGLQDKAVLDTTPESLGLVKKEICPVSGLLATEACRHDSEGREIATDYCYTDATRFCNLHQDYTFCKDSGVLATHYCPEETHEVHSLVIVPDNSTLRTVNEEILTKYLANAVLEAPQEPANDTELAALAQSGTKYYYCPIHTEAWAKEQEEVRKMRQSASTLLREADSVLDQYGFFLNSSWKDRISSQAAALRSYMDETTYPKLADITSAYNSLRSTLDDLYKLLEPLTGDPDNNDGNP